MQKTCKCGATILGQADHSKESNRIEFAKSATENSLVYQFQSKHVNWECDYCIKKKFRRKREKRNDRIRVYY